MQSNDEKYYQPCPKQKKIMESLGFTQSFPCRFLGTDIWHIQWVRRFDEQTQVTVTIERNQEPKLDTVIYDIMKASYLAGQKAKVKELKKVMEVN